MEKPFLTTCSLCGCSLISPQEVVFVRAGSRIGTHTISVESDFCFVCVQSMMMVSSVQLTHNPEDRLDSKALYRVLATKGEQTWQQKP